MNYKSINRRRRRIVRCTLWATFVLAALAALAGLAIAGMSWNTLALAAGLVMISLVAADRWMRDQGGVPVLCYHSINNHNWLPWPTCTTSLATFESHLKVLSSGRFSVIRTADLVAARLDGQTLPPRPVVIHLDDGYLDNWVAAAPLLRHHKLSASLFVSLDFIEDGDQPRPTLADVAEGRARPGDLQWSGYVNWGEIAAMQQSGVIDVLPHGVDHGIVEVSPKVIEHLTWDNWRRLAWVQWRAMAGSKVNWYRTTAPPAVPLGTPVRENAPALAARSWDAANGLESEPVFRERVRKQLSRCRQELGARLNQPMDVFCWPNNGTTRTAREVADEVGFRATTAGTGENRPGEDPHIISRMGVGGSMVGWSWPAAEAIGMYASLRVFQGNYYWFYLLIAFAGFRQLHKFLTRSQPGASTIFGGTCRSASEAGE